MNELTSRARWLAAMHGQPVDRLPFWPKIFASYLAVHRTDSLHSLEALHTYIGSDRHEGIADCLREVRENTSLAEVMLPDQRARKLVYRTPYSDLEQHELWDETTQSWHPVKHPVETLDDIRVMTAFYRDSRWEVDREALELARAGKAALGETAVSVGGIGSSPFMQWIETLAGIENAHLLLADYPEAVGELLEAIHVPLLQRAELLAVHHPADIFYLMENTSTTLLSPDQYRRYNQPHLHAYAACLRAYDRSCVLHMCGKLLHLLPDLATIPAAAFEAFTSPPLGDTTLAAGRRACPTTCLIGGTNAVLWLRPAHEIIAELERHLTELPHHRSLVITSAGIMPPATTPDTIRTVCEWVKGYAARM